MNAFLGHPGRRLQGMVQPHVWTTRPTRPRLYHVTKTRCAGAESFFFASCPASSQSVRSMSRLIVKGLPTYLTDARLREHFAQKGTVTDVKLMRRPDGTSRRFGFVGFRSEAEAEAARAYFDRTYMDTSRISVAVAKQIGDEELEAKKKAGKPDTPVAPPKDTKKQPKENKGASFEEFMSVMAPKLKRKSWMNNEDLGAEVPKAIDVAPEPKKKRKHDQAVQAPTDGAATNEALSDLEYMRRRMRHKVAGDEPKAFEQSDEESESDEEDAEEAPAAEEEAAARRRAQLEEKQRKDEENVDTIMESGRLFVRNLPFSATEDELAAMFESYGSVEQVRILPIRQQVRDDRKYRDNRGTVRMSYWELKIVDVADTCCPLVHEEHY